MIANVLCVCKFLQHMLVVFPSPDDSVLPNVTSEMKTLLGIRSAGHLAVVLPQIFHLHFFILRGR